MFKYGSMVECRGKFHPVAPVAHAWGSSHRWAGICSALKSFKDGDSML